MGFRGYEAWTTQSKTTGSSTFRLRQQRLHGVTVISLIASCGFPSLRWISVTTKLGQRSQRLPGLLRPLGKERRRGSHSDWLGHLLWFFIITMDSCHYEAWTTRQREQRMHGSLRLARSFNSCHYDGFRLREQRLHGFTVISVIASCGFPLLRWVSVTTKLGHRSQELPGLRSLRKERKGRPSRR